MRKIITKTLAEIYLKQGYLQEAYEIYRILNQKNPCDDEISNRLNELEKRLKNSKNQSSKDEILKSLNKWLKNIEKRKKINEWVQEKKE